MAEHGAVSTREADVVTTRPWGGAVGAAHRGMPGTKHQLGGGVIPYLLAQWPGAMVPGGPCSTLWCCSTGVEKPWARTCDQAMALF